MAEVPATTNNNDEWVTVAVASARLGVSERQARRYAGRVAEHDRQEPDTANPMLVRFGAMEAQKNKARGNQSKTPDMSLVRVSLPSTIGGKTCPPHIVDEALQRVAQLQAGHTPDIVTPKAEQEPDALNKDAGHRPDTLLSVNGQGAGHEPDMEPDTATQQAGREPDTMPDIQKPDAGHAPDAVELALLRVRLADAEAREARERELNAFLRTQIEEGNRNAAELRAALRKALEIAPRQLTTGDVAATPERSELAQNDAPAVTLDIVSSETKAAPEVAPIAQNQAPRRGDALSKIREGVRGLFGR